MSKQFSYQLLTRTVLQLEEYITSPFKIDLNDFFIYKKHQNRNVHKGKSKHPQKGTKTSIKEDNKTPTKGQ